MKKLLYLYNDGYRAFPHLGRGGLGYKPPIKIIGDGLHPIFDTDTDTYEMYDDGNYEDPTIYEQLDGSRDSLIRGPITERLYEWYEGPGDQVQFIDDDDDDNMKIQKMKDTLEYMKKDLLNQPIKKSLETDDELEKLINTIQPKADENLESNAINAIKFMNTKGYKDIVSAKSRVKAINNKLEKAKTLSEYDKKLLIKIKDEENAKAKIEAEEKAKTKKEPGFTILEHGDLVQHEPELIEEVLTTTLEDIDGYIDIVKDLNELKDIENVYKSIIDPLESQGDNKYGDTFSLGDKIQTKFNGKDFEQKLGANPKAMNELLKQSLGDNIIINDLIEPSSKWSKADFIATIQQDNVISDIDLEFKKINNNSYNKYNTTEIINRQTKLYFEEWYINFKRKLNEASENACIDETKYKNILETISTNAKLDKHKLKIEHIKSGKYFGLPLSFPKFKTPDETTLLDIMMEKQPTQAEKITKFIRKGTRKNKSINRLVPVYNTKDAILITSLTESLGSNEPFKILNIVDNMYSGSTPNALSVPGCLLKTLKLSKDIIDKSKNINITHMKL